MTFRLRGRSFTITPSDVLEVTRNVPPSQRDGRNKYFVTIHGHQYPIKQVLQLVSGLSRVGFTAQDAHRILSRLGFDIFEDQAPPPNGEITAGTTGGSTSRGVPAIGEATNQDDSAVRKLLVVFETDEDGWEVASCPTLPGCHSQDGRGTKRSTTSERRSEATWRACTSTTSLRPSRPSFRSSRCECNGGATSCHFGRRVRHGGRPDRILARSHGRQSHDPDRAERPAALGTETPGAWAGSPESTDP